ncbi:hypothetical protein [Novosphingobium jiangmenense]|uniref:Uncharacterized protein n=1 Tax=Novosphingobium jiangmenense TaxID=2791981 RepID=A0ABS0HDW4_9SPHN|nr:hypothetical protein [Novosphingobium jiangmenense]MBF9150464.1 hypothetical protein [Novosphingobium jiangmenense]
MRGKWLGALLAGLALLPTQATAQNVFCGPDAGSVPQAKEYYSKTTLFVPLSREGRKILLIAGAVNADAGPRLASALSANPEVEEVWLNSPGGAVVGGLAMGRELRRRGLLVRVPSRFLCESSCTLAFLGGAIRQVDPDGHYGIHMFSRFFDLNDAFAEFGDLVTKFSKLEKAKGRKVAVEQIQADLMANEQSTAMLAGQLARYLVEMSASLEFLTGMFGQQQTGICYLTRDGLRRYNVVNSE